MEWYEQKARPDVGAPQTRPQSAAWSEDFHHVSFVEAERAGVEGGDLHPHIWSGSIQLRGTAGLCAGVEVIDRPAGSELERVFLCRFLVGRKVVGGLEHGFAVGVEGPVLDDAVRRTRHQVLAVGLAHLRPGPADAVGVKAFRPIGGLVVARPLNATRQAQPGVRQTGVVAGPARAAPFPRLESGLGVVPGDQGPAVLVAEVHPGGVVQEDLQVRLCLARRFDGFVGQVHGPVCVGQCAGLLTPRRSRQDHVGQLGGLGQKKVLDHDEQAVLGENRTDTGQLRQGDSRVGTADPQHADRALLGVAEDLHGVGGRGVMRNGLRLDVPHLGQLGDVLVVVPVAKARQVAVGAALAGVLGGGLAVHLQDSGPWPPDHAADQVQVVDLYDSGGGLMGLVDALQDRGQQPVRAAHDLGCLPDPVGRYVTDLGRPLRGAVLDPCSQFVETNRLRRDVVMVDPAGTEDLVQQGIQQRHVGSQAWRKMDGGPTGGLGGAWVDAHQPGRVPAFQPVEDPHPLHRLGLRDVVTEQGDHIGVIDVVVTAGLPITAERLLECLCRRRSAQTGVAVQVVRADTRTREHGKRVVLLQEQLTGGVEADRPRTALVEQRLGTANDSLHGGVPVTLDQPPVLANQGAGQPIGGGVGLPTEQILRSQTAAGHPVHRAAPHAHHVPAADGDVHRVSVGVQDGRRLHPSLHHARFDARGQVRVHTDRPRLVPAEGSAATPRLCDPVHRSVHAYLQDSTTPSATRHGYPEPLLSNVASLSSRPAPTFLR